MFESLFLRLFIFCISLLVVVFLTRKQKKITFSIKGIIFLGVLFRILALILFLDVRNYDTLSYTSVGERVLQGLSIYPDLGYYHHPYFPFLLYIEAIGIHLTSLGLYDYVFLKLFFSAFDIAVVYIIYKLSDKRSALVYALHPSMILLSSAHPQIESVTFAGILLAIYFLKTKKFTYSALVMSFAVLVKTWPFFLMPIFWRQLRKPYVYILSVVFPTLSVFIYSFFYDTSIRDIIHPVLSYRGIYGLFGLGIITSQFPLMSNESFSWVIKIFSNIALLLVMFYGLKDKQRNILNSFLTFLLLICIFVVSGANPLWLLPFVIMQMPRYSSIWLLVIGVHTALIIAMNQVGVSLIPNLYAPLYATVSIVGLILYFLEIGMWLDVRKST